MDTDGAHRETSPTAALWECIAPPEAPWKEMLGLDPEFFGGADRLFSYPYEKGALATKTRELVVLALNALVTQLNLPQLQRSVHCAAQVGATRDEVLCVLQIVSVVGLHSSSVGIPVLMGELRTAGHIDDAQPLTARERAEVERFETSGPRPRPIDEMYGAILRLDPEYFRRFTEWIDVPWSRGILDPATKHLICIAIDVACTHLYVDGLRRHVREALSLEVTKDEILEVIHLASTTGLHSVAAAMPALRTAWQTPPTE
jgi:alkylhydroperoxidase/carboxymuconolactone decarboxylase family protein YurZ